MGATPAPLFPQLFVPFGWGDEFFRPHLGVFYKLINLLVELFLVVRTFVAEFRPKGLFLVWVYVKGVSDFPRIAHFRVETAYHRNSV